jgi:maltose O-acetyltransferase
MYYFRSFSCGSLSMIGERCGIHIFPGGSIAAAGRMIVDDDVMLYAKGKLRIGRQFCINRYSRIVAHEEITIGNNVTIGQGVAILDHDHRYELKEAELGLDGYTTAPVRMGDNIWIGDKCTILKGVTIGSNVVVGAHTLIHKDVPSNVVIGGVPFRILKSL